MQLSSVITAAAAAAASVSAACPVRSYVDDESLQDRRLRAAVCYVFSSGDT